MNKCGDANSKMKPRELHGRFLKQVFGRDQPISVLNYVASNLLKTPRQIAMSPQKIHYVIPVKTLTDFLFTIKSKDSRSPFRRISIPLDNYVKKSKFIMYCSWGFLLIRTKIDLMVDVMQSSWFCVPVELGIKNMNQLFLKTKTFNKKDVAIALCLQERGNCLFEFKYAKKRVIIGTCDWCHDPIKHTNYYHCQCGVKFCNRYCYELQLVWHYKQCPKLKCTYGRVFAIKSELYASFILKVIHCGQKLNPGKVTIRTTDTDCVVCYEPSKYECSRCRSIRYCGKECQHIDWERGHKQRCKELNPPSVTPSQPN